MKSSRRTEWLLAVLAAGIYAVMAWRFPLHGIWHDDGLYVELGQSISSGSYRLGQLVDAPVQSKYPPLFPLLLAPLAACGVDPATEGWVFAIPGGIMAAFGWVLWFRFLRRTYGGRVAGLVTLATAISPGVFVVTSASMSEPVLFVIVPAVLLLLDGAATAKREWLAGVFVGLGLLARTAFIPCAFLLGLWMLRARGFRASLRFAVPMLVLFGPWVGFSLTRPDASIRLYDYYQSYSGSVTTDLLPVVGNRLRDIALGTSGQCFGTLYLPEVVAWFGNTAAQFRDILVSLVCVAVLATVFLRRGVATRVAQVALAGGLLACLPTPWPSWRYALPVLPLMMLGSWSLLCLIVRHPGVRRMVVAVVLILCGAPALPEFPVRPLEKARLWADALSVPDFEAAAAFVRSELPESAVVATEHDPWLHLRTARKTVLPVEPQLMKFQRPDIWMPWLESHARLIIADWSAIGVTHLFVSPTTPPWTAAIIDRLETEGRAKTVWRGRDAGFEILALDLRD